MDISSLQVPRVGRSRFSKALPVPPGLDDQSRAPFRELPDMPPAPPPPKKNSVLIGSISAPNLRSKAFDSPLPVLPIMTEPGRMRARAGPIARKPVAQLHMPSVMAETNTAADLKPSKPKREASLSSLLSAYSRTSSESAKRSSHDESDLTRDSEPSYSPEREGMISNIPPILPKKSMETTKSTNGDSTSQVTSYTIMDSFPPPPPTASSRPRTPSNGHSMDGTEDKKAGSTPLSPISVGSGNGSPHEIWRRRASSKSAASLAVAELKLPGSNGSTASAQSGEKIASRALPSLPPAEPSQQTALPPPSNPPQPPAVAPPPRTVSLRGSNARPIKPAEPFNEDQQKMKFPSLSKIKGLVRPGRDDDDGDGQASSPNSKSRPELPKGQREFNAKVYPEEPHANDNLAYQRTQQQHAPANATLQNPALRLKKSSASMGVLETVSRHPYGDLPSLNLSLPKVDVRIGLEKIDELEPNLRQEYGVSRHLRGFLPHPRSRQQLRPQLQIQPPPPLGSSSQPYSTQNSPAAAIGESHESQPATPSMATLPPGATTIGNLGYRPRVPNSASPEREDAAEDLGGYREFQEGPMSAEAAAAVARFPRKQHSQAECTVDGVWLPSALTKQHHSCHAKHYRLISARNTQYSLACQTCGIADTARRCVCPYCNLRICVPCADLLVANSRDLRATLAVLAEQGKIKEWDAYPKRGADQNT